MTDQASPRLLQHICPSNVSRRVGAMSSSSLLILFSWQRAITYLSPPNQPRASLYPFSSNSSGRGVPKTLALSTSSFIRSQRYINNKRYMYRYTRLGFFLLSAWQWSASFDTPLFHILLLYRRGAPTVRLKILILSSRDFSPRVFIFPFSDNEIDTQRGYTGKRIDEGGNNVQL